MADILSQAEIDRLLDVSLDTNDFPLFMKVKKNNQYGVLEITEQFLKDKLKLTLTRPEEVYERDVIKALSDKKIEVIGIFETKSKLAKSMNTELTEWEQKTKEMKYNKKYLEAHPEYLL